MEYSKKELIDQWKKDERRHRKVMNRIDRSNKIRKVISRFI
jgi:hypothetical protein